MANCSISSLMARSCFQARTRLKPIFTSTPTAITWLLHNLANISNQLIMACLQLQYLMAHTPLVIILGRQHRACINFRSLSPHVVALGLQTRKLVHKRHLTGISLQSSFLATLRPLGAQHHPPYKPNFLTISRLQRTQTVCLSMLTSGPGLRKNRPFHLRSLRYIVDLTVGAGLWTRYWTTETERPTFTSVGSSPIPLTTC